MHFGTLRNNLKRVRMGHSQALNLPNCARIIARGSVSVHHCKVYLVMTPLAPTIAPPLRLVQPTVSDWPQLRPLPFGLAQFRSRSPLFAFCCFGSRYSAHSRSVELLNTVNTVSLISMNKSVFPKD